MTNTPSPFYVATQAQNMGRHATPNEAAAFNKIAMVCMITVALGSVLQIAQPIIKDLLKTNKFDRDETNRRQR